MDIKTVKLIANSLNTPYTDDCHHTGDHIKQAVFWMAEEHDRLTAQLTSAKEERDVLGQAIGEAAVKAGIANGVPMTGPELLLMLDGVVSSLVAAKEEIERLVGVVVYWKKCAATNTEEAAAFAAQIREKLDLPRETPWSEIVTALSAERKETERLRGYESVVKHNAEYQKGYDEGRRFERIEAERLTYELNQIFGMACDAPELNMSNYDVDQVAALNAAMVEIWQIAKAALQERQGEE